ncbi:MAG TPA: DNA primase [Planctomycetota bacterium]|jgi:DNA primase
MSERFSEDLKRRVLAANNLVDVVQASVGKLIRAGRNLKACCPFHDEKTPSFNVNAEGQFFYCFGCSKGGDVITFVMLRDRVSFPEAFRILADRAGIQIESDPRAAEQYVKEKGFKDYLYRLNEVAADFYREQLHTGVGKAAREYLGKRGLSEETCEKFRIGYAPAGGSPLMARLQSQKAPVKAIVAAGLASQRDDGTARDFFYDRVIFPISDIEGRVIAFGGRIMGDGEPKYLNTRDTLLFSKTSTVYGLDHACQEIRNSNQAVIVEGYTDVMMCHQFGVTNVVACLGTAITAEHIKQLRRVADELLIMTDSDAAGAKASERSLTVLFQEQMKARIARLPGADKDPCDFLLAKGKDAFLEALKTPLDLFEFKFASVVKKYDLGTPAGRADAAHDLMGLISLLSDSVAKNSYRREVMKRLNIDERELLYSPAPVVPASVPANGTDVPAGTEAGATPTPESDVAVSERELLRFLFHEPAWFEKVLTAVDLASLSGRPERLIGQAILEALAEGGLPPSAEILHNAAPGEIVAREVLQRLREQADDGIVKEGARALCVALAAAPPKTLKLDQQQRFDIQLRLILKDRLYARHKEANLRLTRAKLQGNAQEEAAAYQEVVEFRREIAKLKSMP